MEENLKAEIADVVSEIFAGKKEDEKRNRTEKALEDSANKIEALTTEIATAKEEADNFSAELKKEVSEKEELIKKVKDLESASEKSEVETKAKLEVIEKELAEKKAELESIAKETVAVKRLSELEEAGVAREDKESQKAKIVDMSDEDFTSYKEELVEVRASIIENLKKEEESGTDTASVEDTKDTVTTQPAEIKKSNAVSAALNMEIHPSEDLVDKYADFGMALAKMNENK